MVSTSPLFISLLALYHLHFFFFLLQLSVKHDNGCFQSSCFCGCQAVCSVRPNILNVCVTRSMLILVYGMGQKIWSSVFTGIFYLQTAEGTNIVFLECVEYIRNNLLGVLMLMQFHSLISKCFAVLLEAWCIPTSLLRKNSWISSLKLASRWTLKEKAQYNQGITYKITLGFDSVMIIGGSKNLSM